MELINYAMPPFARIQWASKEIKEIWEPKFNLARTVYGQLEQLSVVHGLRHCTTAHVGAEDYDSYTQQLAGLGLVFMPIQKVGQYNGMSSYHPPVRPGEKYNYYGVVADSVENAKAFVDATNDRDHTTLGKLLDFPECCVEFFNREWIQNRYFDPIWQQAQNTEGHIKNPTRNAIRLKNLPWETNTLMSAFNIGPTFHKTCSHDCKHTLERSRKWIKLAEDLKINGVEEMKLIMKMPMEWDCFKGIAYIRSPIFKASTNSCMSTERFIVQREGEYYPEEAPMALEFPWNEYYKSKKKLK